ncbi:MAG: hypothetical protein JXB04_04740 [Kiritimatiellae bacterium]|nr:hypothetical protein [Kiritimatiellia bacterium]
MKKTISILLIGALLVAVLPSGTYAGQGRGGFMGFIAGCCFGVRSGGAYNSGKELHFREWLLVIPIVNFVIAIWNGIDGANGTTGADLAARYGAAYY